jgi:hypothetical protein
MPMKYYCIYVSFPSTIRKEKIAASQRFKNRFLFRETARKKYPGFITKKVPFLTMKEVHTELEKFVVENVIYDDMLIVPEIVINELKEELDRMHISCIIDITHEVNVFSIDLKRRMLAMERFWKFFECDTKSPFSLEILKCVTEVTMDGTTRRNHSGNLRRKVHWFIQKLEIIKNLDWTRKNNWDEEPEFYNKIIDKLASPLYHYMTEGSERL